MAITTLKFDEMTEKTIQKLQKAYGAANKAEVIRIALALLDMAMREAQNNRRIAIVDANVTGPGISLILMPSEGMK